MSDVQEARRLSRAGAIGMVVGVLVLIVWALVVGTSALPKVTDDQLDETDEALYGVIVDRMEDGENYYDAAIQEQLDRNYPTAPASAVRTPVLSWIVEGLGETGARVLLGVLLVGSAPLFLRRLEAMDLHVGERYAATLLLLISAVAYLAPIGLWAHEAWALGLMLLSLTLRSDRHWVGAVLLGVAAPFVRELAVVFPVVMLLLALRTDRREAAAWGAGIVAFAGFYAWHVHQVSVHQVPDAPRPPSWVDLGGWPFVVDSMTYGSFVTVMPYVVMAVLTPLALVGWYFVRSPLATRMAFVAIAFALVFMVVGRPVNSYWGTLYAAMLMPGLAFVPRGAPQVWRALRGAP